MLITEMIGREEMTDHIIEMTENEEMMVIGDPEGKKIDQEMIEEEEIALKQDIGGENVNFCMCFIYFKRVLKNKLIIKVMGRCSFINKNFVPTKSISKTKRQLLRLKISIKL